MEELRRLRNRLNKIDKDFEQLALDSAMEHYDVIIDMNVEDQLFQRGVDSTGRLLPAYSPVTVEIKRAQGKPYDRTTLRDEGDFHSDFYVVKEGGGLRISSKDSKTTMLVRDYGEQIFGLTEENLEAFINDFLFTEIRKRIDEYINT